MGQSPLLESSIKSSTCWWLLVKCCKNIPPSMFKLADPPRLKTLGDVLPAFPRFWPQAAPGASLVSIQTSLEALVTEDMQQYGNWYIAVREWLRSVQQRVIEGQITTSELESFKQNYSKMEELYGAFMCSSFLLTLDDIKSVTSAFETTARQLTRCLIYHAPGGQKW